MEKVIEDGVEYLVRKENETAYYYPKMENQENAKIIKVISKNEKNETIFTSYWNDQGGRHRIDGPAIIYPNGKEEFFVNGEKIEAKDTEEFLRLMKLQAFK